MAWTAVAAVAMVLGVCGVPWHAQADNRDGGDDEVCNIAAYAVGAVELPPLAPTPTVTPWTELSAFGSNEYYFVRGGGWVWRIVDKFVVKDGVYRNETWSYIVSDSDIGSTIHLGAVLYRKSGCRVDYTIAYTPPVTVVAAPGGSVETPAVPDAPAQVSSPVPSTPVPSDPVPSSAPGQVKPVKATVSASQTVRKVTPAKPAKVKVKVRRTDGDAPVGRVTVAWGSKKSASKTVRLKASHWGVVTVNLPKLKAGTYKLRTTFTETSAQHLRATAKTLKLTVPKNKNKT
ncbi:MAG: hypothetical protein LBK72_10685 [Bifidobacteriaceae bacterium]|nr:hypothetical protein [Bifidobacteriaceae bacterium]